MLGEHDMSRHAEIRCQQRGIDREVIDTLVVHGRRRYLRGVAVYFMDKRGRFAARRAPGGERYNRIADRLDAYVVVSDDGMRTAAQ